MMATDFYVEAIDRLCFLCGSIIMTNGRHILAVLKEAMNLTFERSINQITYATVVGHRGVRYSMVSAILRCPLFRGVRYSEVSAIQKCPQFTGFHTRFCANSCRSKKMCPRCGGARY